MSPTRLLQLTAFVSTLDRFAMAPMLVAISVDLGVPLATVVHAASVYFLVYGLAQPIWGTVSDLLGRVRTMRLTLLLAAVCTIGSAWSMDTVVLAASRGLAGGFFAAAYPSGLIYLGDTVPAGVRQREIARLMVGVAGGTALASSAAGALADLWSWRVAFVLTGFGALTLVWQLRRLPEPERPATRGSVIEPLRAVAGSRAARFVLALAFTEGAVLIGGLTLLPPAVENAGTSATVAGAVTAVYGVSVYLGSRLIGDLSQRWHPARLIALGAAAATVGCAVLAASRRPVVAMLVAALLGVAWTSMHSTLQTWATEVLPGARAVTVSLFAGSLFVGSAVAAAAVAGLADAGRYATIFALGAALTVPLGLGGTWGRLRWRPSSGHG